MKDLIRKHYHEDIITKLDLLILVVALGLNLHIYCLICLSIMTSGQFIYVIYCHYMCEKEKKKLKKMNVEDMEEAIYNWKDKNNVIQDPLNFCPEQFGLINSCSEFSSYDESPCVKCWHKAIKEAEK